ncbi:hypothetical protein MGN70_012254 [Eutypa lata]|nr:hypothetical protein MGN70_012254 [Eutypa lata]
MHTQWLRAFRTASFYAPRRRLTTHPRRYFHASAVLRSAASPDGNTENDNNNDVPRQDESNTNNDPEKEKGDSTEGQNVEENLFGESTTTSNGDGQGRKKRVGNGSLRSRTLRNRTPEELPPVPLPHDFRNTAVSRIEDAMLVHEKAVRVLKELIGDPDVSQRISDSLDRLAKITHKILGKSQTIHRGVTATIALSYWRAVCLTYELQGADAAAEFLETCPAPWSVEMELLSCTPTRKLIDASSEVKKDLRVALDTVLNHTMEASVLSGLRPIFLEEIIATLRTDFAVEAPKKVKVSDIQRPITVINTSYCKGFTAARVIVRHIATELNADVLHLRAHDLAHIIGNYLGQDVVRAPSPISHLAYKTAELNGRSLSHNNFESHNNDEDALFVPYTQVLREDKLRKDSKKSVMTMDEFLNGTSRAKPGELWEDLKINSVLEELVHAADSEGSEQRPLLVHIDDYNAINMDLEAGSSIIGKIRKVIDGLWVDGRKIALVGTCSSQGAPRAYQEGLKEIAISEHLINLHMDSSLISPGEKKFLKQIEEIDCIDQNERNITDVLLALLNLNSEDSTTPRAKGLGLRKAFAGRPQKKGFMPETWTSRILPLAETYRIATTMIGLCGPDAFNTNALNEAATLIKGVDETNGQLTGHEKDSEGQPKSSISNLRRKDYDADHEEQLLSGLVNAKDIRTTFNHIHAPKETIESIRMLTTLSLIRPEAFSYGVLANERIPGCLLYGPPGTGKTLLAKAVAKESGASMIEVSAATINNMYVGESEKMVRALFRLARKREPLVIFIDEADALLGARSPQRDRASSRGVINQFLREWDGVDDDDNNSDPSSKNKKNKKAFIMVATNRPFDLDEAVLRRLPRKLLIDLPREKDRAAILKIHLRDEELGVGVDLEDLAKKTPLYSGSDLKNVCVAAAMAAVKEELVDPVTGSLVLDSPTDSRGEEEKEEGERESDGDKKEQQQEFKKRILQPRHFEAALKEIGASVSEDMQTLTAIRRFDERYGDSVTGSKRKSRRSMGFEVVPESRDSDGARVRVAAVEGGERGR